MTRFIACAAASIAIAAPLAAQKASSPAAGRGSRFEITVPPAVRGEALTGRVYVMIARTNDREPRLQIGRTGTPFFGRDIEMLPPGRAAVLDQTDLGTPSSR